MKLITKNIHYAIKALLYFSKYRKKIISVGELVEKLGVRRAFLRGILQVLSRHKILVSLRGANGGFILKRRADEIKILELINIFRKADSIIECLFEKGICPHPKKCLLIKKISGIEDRLNNVLGKLTIADLLKSVK